MNPEEERTIPIQAADANLRQTTPDPTADITGSAAQTTDISASSQQTADITHSAGTEQSGAPADQTQGYPQNPNAQYNGAQGYPQNPNAQFGAGMNAGYNAGVNQADAQFNNAQGYSQNPNAQYNGAQGYPQNPNAQFGAGMNAGYNAGVNQADAQFNNVQGYPQNPNAQYNGAQGYPQNPNAQFGAGMNAGYNVGVNQADAQFNNAQGYPQNPNAQYNNAGMNNGYGSGTNQTNTQYGGAQGYQNPYYVNPASVPNAVPSKKKSKKKIWIPIVSVVLVAVIAVGVYFLVTKKTRNPEEVITTAMSNTFPAGRTSSTAGWRHSQELDTLAQDGAYQMRTEFRIDELSGSLADEYDLSILESLGISSTMTLDKDAERFSSIASVLYDGISYLNYECYAYDDYFAVACPDLFDGYIEFQTSNFGIDFNNSPLAEALDTTVDPTFAFRFFELFNTVQQTETEVPRELQEFFDSIRFEEGDKKDLQVNGKTQTCQGYRIIVTRESMERLLNWFCDYATSLGTPIEFQDVAPLLPNEDFVMTVYVDNKGRMARFSFDFPLDSAQAELNCQIDFIGLNDKPADHIKGELKIIVEGYAYGFSFESITEASGSTETQNTTMSIDVSGISVANATFISTFDTQSRKGSLDLSISAMYMSLLSMDFDYSYTDIVPGESYTVNVDDLSLDVAGELKIRLSGSASLSKLHDPVPEPSGTKYDLFTMTEDDVLSLSDEIYQNVLNGPLGSLFIELLYDGYYLHDDFYYGDDDLDYNY